MGVGPLGASVASLVRVLVVAIKLHLTPIVVVGLSGVHAVLIVVDLTGQAVSGHALLGCNLIGAHLQGDGRGVTVLQIQLPVKDVPPGSRGCHASLRTQEQIKKVFRKLSKLKSSTDNCLSLLKSQNCDVNNNSCEM